MILRNPYLRSETNRRGHLVRHGELAGPAIREERRRNNDICINHGFHSAFSSRRDWVIHSATSSSQENPACAACSSI